jgi:aryl-alcohol dehydrogenase-like predicted oxidoreductase
VLLTGRAGLGDLSLAIAADRGVDAREVERALAHALELGLSIVDVHPGETDAEKLAAATVRSLRARDRVVIATTVPLVPLRPGGPPRRDVLPEQLPPRYVVEHLESTLRAARLEALPLVQLPLNPVWRHSSAWTELTGTCARMIHEGKALAFAARLYAVEHDYADTRPLVSDPAFAALSVVFNLCDRSAEPLLAHTKIPVLARQPLAGRALAGTLGPGVKLPPRDDRGDLDERTLERIAVTAARLAPELEVRPPAATSCDAAKAVLERGRRPEQLEVRTEAELALRFVMDRGAIALPRLHRHAHVLEAVAAASALPLSAALVDRILVEKP